MNIIKIGIIDADLIGRDKHRFPNLASMKLSGYHKELGNSVTLITDYRNLFSEYIELPNNEIPNFQFIMYEDINKTHVRYYKEEDLIYDKVIISKVFTETKVPLQILSLPNCKHGGTGFFYDKAEPLTYEIEHSMPDYHLYDEWVEAKIVEKIDLIQKKKNKVPDKKEIKAITQEFEYYKDYSIGFTTRGCFRKCEFCVNKKYNKVELHSQLEEFVDKDRKYICLLDDNILGYPKWKNIIQNLKNMNKPFQYKQGMDERIMTDDKAKMLTECKYHGDFIFAFDNIEDKDLIIEKLRLWKKYCNKTTKLYVFCGFDRNDKWDEEFWRQDIIDTFERIKILMEHGCLPYIMRFNKYEESPYKGTYINFAAWCNQPSFFKKKSYREWCQADADRKKGKMCSSLRYLNELEKTYPEIAKEYFDLKYEDLNRYKKDDNICIKTT